MQELIASADHLKFDLEMAVEQQLGAQPLPFPGMDSKLTGALMNICFVFWFIIIFQHIRRTAWYIFLRTEDF